MKQNNKKYTFTEYQSNEDKHWNLRLQNAWNEKGKKANKDISRKHASKYQLEQLALYQLKEQAKLNKEKRNEKDNNSI